MAEEIVDARWMEITALPNGGWEVISATEYGDTFPQVFSQWDAVLTFATGALVGWGFPIVFSLEEISEGTCLVTRDELVAKFHNRKAPKKILKRKSDQELRALLDDVYLVMEHLDTDDQPSVDRMILYQGIALGLCDALDVTEDTVADVTVPVEESVIARRQEMTDIREAAARIRKTWDEGKIKIVQ